MKRESTNEELVAGQQAPDAILQLADSELGQVSGGQVEQQGLPPLLQAQSDVFYSWTENDRKVIVVPL